MPEACAHVGVPRDRVVEGVVDDDGVRAQISAVLATLARHVEPG